MINFAELLWKPGRTTREPRLQSTEAASDIDNAPELHQLPVEHVQVLPRNRVALLTDPRGPGADRLRLLRMRLRELKELAKLQSLLITSPMPGDGKSTIALNLATALAERGKRRVLLIEADLYHPSTAEGLGLEPRAGLAECLEHQQDPMALLRRLEPLGWYLLPSGKPESNPTELLQSDSFSRIMRRLSPFFDWILIDTPPVIPLTDAVSLSRQVDASLLVVRADRTPREVTEEALSLIGQKHVLGIIFNGTEKLNRAYSKYYGHYGK